MNKIKSAVLFSFLCIVGQVMFSGEFPDFDSEKESSRPSSRLLYHCSESSDSQQFSATSSSFDQFDDEIHMLADPLRPPDFEYLNMKFHFVEIEFEGPIYGYCNGVLLNKWSLNNIFIKRKPRKARIFFLIARKIRLLGDAKKFLEEIGLCYIGVSRCIGKYIESLTSETAFRASDTAIRQIENLIKERWLVKKIEDQERILETGLLIKKSLEELDLHQKIEPLKERINELVDQMQELMDSVEKTSQELALQRDGFFIDKVTGKVTYKDKLMTKECLCELPENWWQIATLIEKIKKVESDYRAAVNPIRANQYKAAASMLSDFWNGMRVPMQDLKEELKVIIGGLWALGPGYEQHERIWEEIEPIFRHLLSCELTSAALKQYEKKIIEIINTLKIAQVVTGLGITDETLEGVSYGGISFSKGNLDNFIRRDEDKIKLLCLFLEKKLARAPKGVRKAIIGEVFEYQKDLECENLISTDEILEKIEGIKQEVSLRSPESKESFFKAITAYGVSRDILEENFVPKSKNFSKYKEYLAVMEEQLANTRKNPRAIPQ